MDPDVLRLDILINFVLSQVVLGRPTVSSSLLVVTVQPQ